MLVFQLNPIEKHSVRARLNVFESGWVEVPLKFKDTIKGTTETDAPRQRQTAAEHFRAA
jgi:hypothetical protein